MKELLNNIRFKKLTAALESDKNMMALLELSFQAGVEAEKKAAQHKPCEMCEALARTVMLDQSSNDASQRTWVGLTDEDLAVCGGEDDVMLARYWERVCKEKNT